MELAILRMVADLTTKSFFVVKSVTIRNGAVRSALVDARRRSPTLSILAMGGAKPFSRRRCRPLLFCARRRYTMVQMKKRCSKRCRPSGIRRSDYGRGRVHGKLR